MTDPVLVMRAAHDIQAAAPEVSHRILHVKVRTALTASCYMAPLYVGGDRLAAA